MKKKKWFLPVSVVGGAILLCIVAVVAFGAKGSGAPKGRLHFAENGTYQIDSDGSLLFAQEVDFDAQYIRTGTRNYEGPFPAVAIIHSADELTAYYEDNKDQFDLERRGDYGRDFTMGYLDACDKYDATFFENNALIFIVLEEGSGSIRHSIETVKVDTSGNVHVDIRSIVPEAGTCDMAYWHIITAVPKDKVPDKADDVVVHYNGREYSHSPASCPDYSFSLTWGVYGISSYDSETGTLIKTKDATNPKDYKTNLKLTPKQYTAIWKLIKGLDIASYPDEYNPHGNGASTPYMTLILSVKADGIDKTVTVEETVLSYETDDAKGQKFLDVCKGIRDILTETDAWKALPEYEFLYD